MPSLDRKIHRFVAPPVFTQTFAVSGRLRSDISPLLTNCLRFPSPSAQFVSCLFRLRSRADAIPPHLLNYLRLPEKKAPVSPVSQLSFQACQPPPPLSSSQILLHSRFLMRREEKLKANAALSQPVAFLLNPDNLDTLIPAPSVYNCLLFPNRSSSTSFLLEVPESLQRSVLPSVFVSLNCGAASLWNRKLLEVLRAN